MLNLLSGSVAYCLKKKKPKIKLADRDLDLSEALVCKDQTDLRLINKK